MSQPKDKVPLTLFCSIHKVEVTFVERLEECGVIDVFVEDNDKFLSHDQLEVAERLLRLHRELNINVEGLETVFHLTELVAELKDEIRHVKSRLLLYED